MCYISNTVVRFKYVLGFVGMIRWLSHLTRNSENDHFFSRDNQADDQMNKHYIIFLHGDERERKKVMQINGKLVSLVEYVPLANI